MASDCQRSYKYQFTYQNRKKRTYIWSCSLGISPEPVFERLYEELEAHKCADSVVFHDTNASVCKTQLEVLFEQAHSRQRWSAPQLQIRVYTSNQTVFWDCFDFKKEKARWSRPEDPPYRAVILVRAMGFRSRTSGTQVSNAPKKPINIK